MSDSSKAVFLSYASQDADTVRVLAESLRAAGVEVWFDQNELVGGDAWDAKIRKQIKECVLFIPIVSAATQLRLEGYFRLEWKLAAQRSHTMAEERTFLLPVVIDGTRETEAKVPPEFHAVQWTRLPGDGSPEGFVEHIRSLLGSRIDSARAIATNARRELPTPAQRSSRIGWVTATTVLFALALAVGAFAWWRTEKGATDKSIAVLPFENLSEDREGTSFFADGMHEDILTSLGNIRDFRVVSRTSVMDYRGTTKKIPQIARELGVAYILVGSVRRAGDQVRITGQLIRADRDEQLWAKSYDRDLTVREVFAIQASLSTEIAGALHAAISPATKEILERRPTENLAAYDLFLKTRPFTYSGTGPLTEQAKKLEEVVALDPDFAEAWGELAVTHAAFYVQHYDRTPERLARADAAIARAIRLAPDAPEIMRLLGMYANYAYADFDRAAEQFQKVIRLQPRNAAAIYNLALLQRRQGKWRESMENLRRAIELDPGNTAYAEMLVVALAGARRWHEAIAIQRRIISDRPKRRVSDESALALLAFNGSGSTREVDAFLASISPADLADRRLHRLCKLWAYRRNDYAEWRRLDRTPSPPDDNEITHWERLLEAAVIMAVHQDQAEARSRLGDASAQVRTALERQPSNVRLVRILALMKALLGHPEEALRYATQAAAMAPEDRDTLWGAHRNLAVVYTWTGHHDKAVVELARLLKSPTGRVTVHSLKLDPEFAPLRGDPRFEALLKDPKNNAPLF